MQNWKKAVVGGLAALAVGGFSAAAEAGFHGGHVASGVVFLIMVLINTVNGTYDQRGHYEMVEKIGLYWHFVDLVWVFVFTCFYLL